MKTFLYTCLLAFLAASSSASAESCCHMEIAPAFMRIDVLESGKTVHQANLLALRAEACYRFCQGFNLKPVLIAAPRCIDKSSLFAGGVALGHFYPVYKNLCLNPNFGVTYTIFKTKVTYELFPIDISLKEEFRSVSPFVGLDVNYSINECWRIYASFQYAWSRTHTTVKYLFSTKDHSQGTNWGLAVETDMTEALSVNFGVGYNLSMSREKHGIRAFGGKVALAYWY